MTRVCGYPVRRMATAMLLSAVSCLPGLECLCQTVYHTPPKEISDVINAPSPLAAHVSPTHDQVLLAEPVRFPDISDLARPMFRVAGLRIDPANNGAHLPQRFINWQLVTVTSGASLKVAIPAAAYAGAPYGLRTESVLLSSTTGVRLPNCGLATDIQVRFIALGCLM